MADLTGANLDPNVEENSGGFTVVPDGKYQVVIVGDKLKDTKAGTGSKCKDKHPKGRSCGKDIKKILEKRMNL